MREISRPQQGEGSDRMIARSLKAALETILARSEEGDRLALLQTLRSQMEQVLAEAPVSGDTVQAIALRSDLAALFEAEFTRQEACEIGQEGS